MPKGNITGSKVIPEENLLDKPASSLIAPKGMKQEEFEAQIERISNVVAGATKLTRKIYSAPIVGAKFCANIFALIAAIFCKTFAEKLFPDIYKALDIEKKVKEFIEDRGKGAHSAIAGSYEDIANDFRQMLQKERLIQTPKSQTPSPSPAPVEATELKIETTREQQNREERERDDVNATIIRNEYINISDKDSRSL